VVLLGFLCGLTELLLCIHHVYLEAPYAFLMKFSYLSKKNLTNKLFKVGSFFSSLACSVGSHFPWKSVWRTQAPSLAAYFEWLAVLDKILTMDNLKKRHVILIDRCYMCKRNEESVDNLLLHYDVAYTYWSALFTRFGLSWVLPRRAIDLFVCCCDLEDGANMPSLMCLK
jgi:hypothetical protein